MQKNSNLIVLPIGLLISFCIAVPVCIAGESEKLNRSQENATSKAGDCSSTFLSEATKQTDLAVENKKEAGGTKDKNLLSAPAQVNQEILDFHERRRTGNLLFPTNCVPAKDIEEMQRMARTGTMQEHLMQAGFSKARYNKFVEAVRSIGSKDKSTSAP